jgi:biotin operon repressor
MAYWHHEQLIDHGYKKLSNAAQNIGQVLAGMMNEKDQWQISRARLQEKTGKSRSTITKATRDLVAAGVLVAYRQGRRSPTQYLWALSCPPECHEKSHAPSELPKSRTTERATLQATEWPTLLATNTPENKPINKRDHDPRHSGQTIIETLKSELTKLMSSGKAPLYETHNNYGDPLERLLLAIHLDPDGVEKKLKTKTKGAKNLTRYIAEILTNNPHTLISEDLEDSHLLDLHDLAAGDVEELPIMTPPEALSAPKTTSATPTTPAPTSRPSRAVVVAGVSPANMAWLGDRPTEYQLRCAKVADELGLIIPVGVDAPQVGQLLVAARELVEAGEQPENPTTEIWLGRATLKRHTVTISD